MQLEPEAFAETVNGLEDLVALRNQLAHHSIERFDPLEPPELRRRRRLPGAQLHAQVDRHLLELLEWARHADKARALMASAPPTDAIQEHLTQPPPIALNADASIVQCLRDAQAFLAVESWTLLGLHCLYPDHLRRRIAFALQLPELAAGLARQRHLRIRTASLA